MTTPDAQAGLQTFDALNITYEKAYQHNPFKRFCIEKAITLLPPQSHILDIGCGTGIPVSQMLANAGMHVHGFDISPKMIAYAQSRVKGEFVVSDMLEYAPQRTFAGVFMIFSQLQLSYASLHAAVWKFAQTLEPNGIFVLGQMPGDDHVNSPAENSANSYSAETSAGWDSTHTYVEDYPAPFMGEMLPTLMLSRQGQRDFLTSMGLEIVSQTIDMFQPDNEVCVPEEQQYLIARRVGEGVLVEPKPPPRERS